MIDGSVASADAGGVSDPRIAGETKEGGPENDELTGTSGDDILRGLGGNDSLDGLAGEDRMEGGTGDDIFYVDEAGDQVVELASEGIDEVRSSISYTLGVNVENLVLTGNEAIDGTGNSGNNRITGNGAANTFISGGGTDTFVGGGGDDIYHVEGTVTETGDGGYSTSGGAVIIEEAGGGIDTVYSNIGGTLRPEVENMILTGSAAVQVFGNGLDNRIIGNSGRNFIRGEGGDDYLDGGIGPDSMDGGAGNDTYVVDHVQDMIGIESPEENQIDTVLSYITYTLPFTIENLTLLGDSAINGTGGHRNNVINGNSAANVLLGEGGNDVVNGGGGADTIEGGFGQDVINDGGGADNDKLYGGPDNDILTASAGNDLLDGGTGADTMQGGAGNDLYIVDNAGDGVTEGAGDGTDRVRSSVTHTLAANVEHLDLVGTANLNGIGNGLTNQITGNSGNNVLDGGGGTDLLFGGDGNDTYVLETAGDRATETSATGGTDTVRAAFNYTLTDHIEHLELTGTGHINGTGNALANTITGNSGNNRLDGGLGADVLRGGLGNDTYVIDASDTFDEASGGGGIDTLVASFDIVLGADFENLTLTGAAVNGTGNALNNILIGNANANSLNALDGNDTLDGGAGADTLTGGTGNDIYVFDNLGDNAVEALDEGQDQVRSSVSMTLAANVEILVLTGTAAINGSGNGLSNQILGNGAANVLDGGAGLDFMYGADGDDTYIVDALGERAVEVSAAGGTDTVLSSVSYGLSTKVENLTLTGSASINAKGNELNNVLIGNSGNNYLIGNAGADLMAGGAGNDIYEVDNAGDTVVENSSEGTDMVQSSITHTLGANVENLTLTGAASINGTGNALNNVITGNNAANSLNGLDGNDTLIGGAGADTLAGGLGDDVYHADAGDTLVEAAAAGTDRVQIGSNYTLVDNFENLVLTGTANINGTGNGLDNILTGNIGNNVLDGGAGADLMFGEEGNDTYIVDNIGDRANEGSDTGGTDSVLASVSFTLGNRVENLTLTGSANINGRGNALDNAVTGNGGDNVLWGGLGADALNGNGGDDTFLYTAIAESTATSTDSISGFGSGDTIDLAAIDADTGTDGNQAFAYVGDAAFTGTAGELRAYQSGGDWFVEADVDGDGAADLVIGVTTADPAYLFSASDFVL